MYASQLLSWLSEGIIAAYLDDCQDRALSDKTIEWYAWHLRRARDWLASEPDHNAVELVTPDGLAAYYRSTRELASSSRRHMVGALRAFGTWLETFGLENPASQLRRPKADDRLPDVLAPSDIKHLIQAMYAPGTSLRERALVFVLLDTGIRVSELVALTRPDLALDAGQITIRSGKGRKGRVVYFSKATSRALADYLATHDQEHVFIAEREGRPPAPLTDNGVRQLLRRLAARIGLDKVTPHILRRTCGTEYHAMGVALDVIGDQFGHSETSTTRLYARLADERRRDLMLPASPVMRAISNAAIPVPDWPTARLSRHD